MNLMRIMHITACKRVINFQVMKATKNFTIVFQKGIIIEIYSRYPPNCKDVSVAFERAPKVQTRIEKRSFEDEFDENNAYNCLQKSHNFPNNESYQKFYLTYISKRYNY